MTHLFDKAATRSVGRPGTDTLAVDSHHKTAAQTRLTRAGIRDVVLVVLEGYSSYHHPVINRLRENLDDHGYDVVCVCGHYVPADDSDDGRASIYRLATSMDVAGVIVMSSLLGRVVPPEELSDFIAGFAHRPIVTVGMSSEHCPSVMPDNMTPMRELVEHMTDNAEGKRIAFMRGIAGNPDADEREQAFRDVLAERGLAIDESRVFTGNFRVSDGFAAIDRAIAQGNQPDIIIAANDLMATGAVLALKRHGLKVPEDILISGFDDSAYASNSEVPLTTVKANPEDQVTVAASVLVELMASDGSAPATCTRVPSQVVFRASSQPLVATGDSKGIVGTAASCTSEFGGAQLSGPQSTAAYVEYVSCHEAIEQGHIQLARCVELDAVYRVFSDVMESLGIERAFVLQYQEGDASRDESFSLLKTFPAREAGEDWNHYPVSRLLPESLQQELNRGSLVAASAHLDQQLRGILMFDPKGPCRLSLDGLTQSLFSALYHCQQRVYLVAQARKLERANAKLERMASFDSLTGLANRARLHSELKARISSPSAKVAVLYFDLDGFKMVNDTMGHGAGDKLLTIVASRVRGCVRSTDVVSRLGGDEFSVMLGDISSREEAQAIADQLLAEISRPMRLSRQHKVSLSASIGIARFPMDGEDAETLIKHSDTAMYEAKSEGKNRVVWFTADLNKRVQEQLRLDQSMREGLENGEFRLAFQPRMDLRTKQIIGVEALLRWTNSDGADISPMEFIPVAEQTGFVRQLDTFALNSACEQASAWHARGIQCRVAVNISVVRLQQKDVVEEVRAALARHDVPHGLIEFEVTESVAMTELRKNIDKLEAFRELGIRLSIDDFGTAYSSLSYLKHLPVDCLKIDRSFMSAIEKAEDELSPDGRIIRAVVGLGASLGLQVAAEGVENEAQHRFLMKLGCDEAQGFLFAHPLELDMIDALLEQRLGDDASLSPTGT